MKKSLLLHHHHHHNISPLPLIRSKRRRRPPPLELFAVWTIKTFLCWTAATATSTITTTTNLPVVSAMSMSSSSSNNNGRSSNHGWIAHDDAQAELAKSKLQVWPLDESNAALLNEVHPFEYQSSTDTPHEMYDLIAIGSGAGGLVSSKQSARRGAKSALLSAHLAGGDCLNVGCVPSKALLRSAKAIAEVKRASEFGVVLPTAGEDDEAAPPYVDFAQVMARMRQLRTKIAPADGHEGTAHTGAHVFQGFGTFTGPNTVQVNGQTLQFRKAVIATGGRPAIPSQIPGLAEAPYTTNEQLFNLQTLPPRVVILGAGIIALEMAQCFARFGSHVTVLGRSPTLLASKYGDAEAAELLQTELEQSGVRFLLGSKVKQVETIRHGGGPATPSSELPLMKVTVQTMKGMLVEELDCECLLVATGRVSNVEQLGLDQAGIEYEGGKGVTINDLAQTTNPNVYAIGDAAAGVPRFTHMSGEMAKLVVQNALFGDDWRVSSFVVPAVAYTEPEYATVGICSEAMAEQQNIAVDVYRSGLEHNDRAILEGNNKGFCKILCRQGTDDIVGCTIVGDRAGEMMNEVTLAMKYNLGLKAIGRNIHSYPTMGEAVMGCGIAYINAHWKKMN